MTNACPLCRGTNLVRGKRARELFVPERIFMWLGYQARSFACTDCGFVGHRLDDAQLANLKRKLAEPR